MFGVFVPEMEGSIAAGGAERAMNRVERDSIDGINVIDIALVWGCLSMTLEAEVRARVLVFHVLNSTAALNAANSKTCGICKAADYSRLPLERGLHSLVEFGGVVEIDDIDVSVRSPNH